jgi:hypothetical protein
MIRTRALRLLAGIAVAVPAALLLGASPASAHPMPHSVVLLDVHESSVSAELELPVDELYRASGIDLRTVGAGAIPADPVRAYLTAHIRPATTTGQAWTVRVGDLSLSRSEQTSTGPYRELVAHAVLTPPAGGDVRRFSFGYDVIVHQVVTHIVLVSVRQDWAAGQFGGDGEGAEQVGTIRIDTRSMTIAPLRVDLGDGSAWRGFLAMVRLGGDHILTGTDHLLFLLILLLPAPLLAVRGCAATDAWSFGRRGEPGPLRGCAATDAWSSGRRGEPGPLRGCAATDAWSSGRRGEPGPLRGCAAADAWSYRRRAEPGPTRGRWRGLATARVAIGRIGRTTLAFTAGHSVALALSSFGRLDIPSWPVEAFIAASILVGAVHAIRPLFPGREALVAGLFGLGHGMAFSFVLAEMQLSTGRLALSLLGFNLGIELVQLLLVALALPGWLADRLGLPNVVARLADSAGAHTTPMVVGLAATAVLAGAWMIADRRPGRQAIGHS